MEKDLKVEPEQWQKGDIAEQRTKDRKQYLAAPSACDGVIEIYKELLEKSIANKNDFNACVLGVTPELRNIVLERGGNLTSIDINSKMFGKVKPYIEYNGKEKIVIGDWLDNQLVSESYNVVLGDGVSNNISFKEQDKFFREISRLIKKDSYVILREAAINPKRPIRSVEDIDKDFINRKIHWFDLLMDLYFYSDISDNCYDKETYTSDLGRLYRDIELCYKQGRLSKKTFNAIWWFKSDIKHTFMPYPALKEFFEKQFVSLPTKQAQDFNFTKDTFIFYFGKKK